MMSRQALPQICWLPGQLNVQLPATQAWSESQELPQLPQ